MKLDGAEREGSVTARGGLWLLPSPQGVHGREIAGGKGARLLGRDVMQPNLNDRSQSRNLE